MAIQSHSCDLTRNCLIRNCSKLPIQKLFKQFLTEFKQKFFCAGPPENVRDHVMAATKSIMGGHWQEAYHYLSSLTVWNLIGGAKENVLVLLKAKLQVLHKHIMHENILHELRCCC